MGERIGVADEEWEVIGLPRPPEQGHGCRRAQDNRPYFEGMMWIVRTGVQWRHLPDEHDTWNRVLRRYRLWVATGVFDAVLETLAKLAGRDKAAKTIDSTVVRAHHCAVGIERGAANRGAWPIARRLYDESLRRMRCQRPLARFRRSRLSQTLETLCLRSLADRLAKRVD